MTDGVPTFSNKVSSAQLEGGVLYGTDFDSNSLDEPSFTSQLWMMNGNNRTPAPYTVSGETINDTWAATLGEAKIAKDDGAEIHTLESNLARIQAIQMTPRTHILAKRKFEKEQV